VWEPLCAGSASMTVRFLSATAATAYGATTTVARGHLSIAPTVTASRLPRLGDLPSETDGLGRTGSRLGHGRPQEQPSPMSGFPEMRRCQRRPPDSGL
jgi:hypothetical protein